MATHYVTMNAVTLVVVVGTHDITSHRSRTIIFLNFLKLPRISKIEAEPKRLNDLKKLR